MKNISFINYAGYTNVSNTEEKQNKEIELRHCLLVSLNRIQEVLEADGSIRFRARLVNRGFKDRNICTCF